MQRQNIRLLALARSGDAQARCEVGRRFLAGSDGFTRHLASGLEYLAHPAVAASAAADRIVAEHMRLDEIVQARMLLALERAADAGCSIAQAKLAAWWLARHPAAVTGTTLLQAAARQGCIAAQAALDPGLAGALKPRLQTLAQHGLLDAHAVAHAAAQQALAARELQAAAGALAAAIALAGHGSEELPALLVRMVEAAESAGEVLAALPAGVIEPLLEARACAGDRVAAHALGRALCGIDLGRLPAWAIAEGRNLRKGAALLLRAADAGCEAAWLQLYRLHADHHHSVANPQMARFFLEKAAACGVAEAQRRLGALLLRGASTLPESEQALGWLHSAAAQGDEHARLLLRSLVLPLEGDEDAAEAAIAAVANHDQWLAARLRIAREFGLTKLEALCFDPSSGRRPWGLVVGKNPFIAKIRLSAPRAIPALRPQALQHLRAVAERFSRAGAEAARQEGDLRRRSLNQRRLFAALGLEEAMFFAVASSGALDSFRLGGKWAFRARQPLRMALAD
ncbi:hypothetical protein [Roseateles violae]|uniref:Sel1 repeat family protein n=1 Tax=Roseateles violae TaxID=3058042 RepID=A0ABT8DZ94_9BURK|nr:hypothetical protein [Pelomonas sp. PFR6]MDN3922921.1 hypothetical protein [Pelomonas sp. PFR6]